MLARVWPLGQLLLGENGSLYGVGVTVTPREDRPIGYTSEQQRERDALRTMASRAGIPLGTPIHLETTQLFERDSGFTPGDPLVELDGNLAVRWSALPGAAPRALNDYLDERVSLLIDRAEGAGA